MPLNRDFIGRTYGPSEPYEVGREKIREFADAIGDPNPAYRDPEAARALGHRDVVAPPTFPMVLTGRGAGSPLADPELGVDYAMLVHGEQSFAYTRPIHPGDRLAATVTLSDMRSVGRNEMLTLVTEYRADDGELVVTGTNTVVMRGTAAPSTGQES